MGKRRLNAVRTFGLGLALVASACAGSATTTTTATPATSTTGAGGDSSSTTIANPVGQLVFGSGEMPSTFPADFPIPTSAKIGSTMIDGANDRSEMILRVAASQDSLVVFYGQNFEQRGYTYSTELRADGQAFVTFSKDDVAGTILVREAATDLSEAIVRIGF
jgi:hypothetical protein